MANIGVDEIGFVIGFLIGILSFLAGVVEATGAGLIGVVATTTTAGEIGFEAVVFVDIGICLAGVVGATLVGSWTGGTCREEEEAFPPIQVSRSLSLGLEGLEGPLPPKKSSGRAVNSALRCWCCTLFLVSGGCGTCIF